MKEIYPHIFCHEIILPNNPLRSLNSYFILSDDRNLIIDTGFNRKECETDFLEGISKLDIDMTKTDILLTHLHSDHSGLAGLALEMGATIYSGEYECKSIESMGKKNYWKFFDDLMKLYGLEKYGISVEDHPGYRYRPTGEIECQPLKEADQINVGQYSFSIIHLPGHTPGHIGLYEKEHKIFFSGDHILSGITPNIISWGLGKNSLDAYISSLEKLQSFDIDLVFAGHRQMITNPRERINELLSHHEERLQEVETIVGDSFLSASEVASFMKWELKIDRWDNFPKAQKWFSAGEAMAHLEYLFGIGKADRSLIDGVCRYKNMKYVK